jgi:hypothetical protein
VASPNIYQSGLSSTGPTIATETGCYFSGGIQWLDTVNGNDANAGTDRELPVKTLAQAVTNSAANGLIVIEAGSYETLASSQSLSLAGLSIIGLGTGSTRPRYTCSGTVDLFSITGAGVRIYNLYFPASTAAATSRIKTAAAETEINGCYFECGTNDTGAAMLVAASGTNCRIINCTAAVTASRPAIGLSCTGAVTDLYVKNLTVDGGSYGWTDYAVKVSAAATRMLFDGVTLLNRSDLGVTVTATTYKFFGIDPDPSCRVVITA